MTYMTHLQCSLCGETYDFNQINNLCKKCSRPLFVRYDLNKLRKYKPSQVFEQVRSMWRHKKLMPVLKEENIVSLEEGLTPIIHAKRIGEEPGLSNLYINDESLNPTGSFKARGLSCAISRAK